MRVEQHVLSSRRNQPASAVVLASPLTHQFSTRPTCTCTVRSSWNKLPPSPTKFLTKRSSRGSIWMSLAPNQHLLLEWEVSPSLRNSRCRDSPCSWTFSSACSGRSVLRPNQSGHAHSTRPRRTESHLKPGYPTSWLTCHKMRVNALWMPTNVLLCGSRKVALKEKVGVWKLCAFGCENICGTDVHRSVLQDKNVIRDLHKRGNCFRVVDPFLNWVGEVSPAQVDKKFKSNTHTFYVPPRPEQRSWLIWFLIHFRNQEIFCTAAPILFVKK